MNLKDYVYNVENFPKEGISFKDITPILNDAQAFKFVIDKIKDFIKESGADVIIAPEARGFLFASAAAYASNTRFALARKPGKLPREVLNVVYKLEYGEDRLEVHKDDIKPNDKVVILDDVLASGGTIDALVKLVHKINANVVGVFCVIDLVNLHSPDIYKDLKFKSLIQY